ncbi:MAG TPA: SGNH/GDSL hydrolase family protein [Verrucomicrobiota bacterium]|nr:SGNH/GDSL hydrolase family protein [Verrucomicrobiota bacterium]HNU51823.1 SGNH/GDSL hydrolase family protein [Verrucomicrobiota bacterium]
MKTCFGLVWRRGCLGLVLGLLVAVGVPGRAADGASADALASKFKLLPAPSVSGPVLREGDRLAICGDSITEQRMYSRVIETYVTVCVPELQVSVRQYGWGGETAPGFLRRMTNDCLIFQPTVATTCYGMNDHGYRAYEPAIGEKYREASRAIIRAFKGAGARVVHGSPGCVGSKVEWSQSNTDAMNQSLCALRNLGIQLAGEEGVGFADMFWPMMKAGETGRERYGADYRIAGKDGVHPDWAGHVVMAYAFLKALGLNGEIGRVTVDLAQEQVAASSGHEVHGFSQGTLTLTSHRYPFCATGDLNRDNSIRSAMTLVPFNAELNRFQLVVKGAARKEYRVVWGNTARVYKAEDLARGINLAEDFVENPFSEAFRRVDEAVAAKQAYETRQVKTLFHGEESLVDFDAIIDLTELVRARYVSRIAGAFKPVTHALRIQPE